MTDLDVLIISTGHDSEDGRLIRHKKALERNNIPVAIECIRFPNRFARFTLGPFRALKIIKDYNSRCVILPDPELQLFLPFFLHKRMAVISDIHENYNAVRFDRAWIRNWMIPFVRTATQLLQFLRNRYSHSLITVDDRICPEANYQITNCPHPDDLPKPVKNIQSHSVVYVGDIRETRGFSLMLKILQEIPTLRLELIGPTSMTNLEDIIDNQGLSDRVVWHGRKSYDESWEIARNCLAGLSLLSDTPAFRSAHPTKIWEYWMVGLPVLATDLPGQSQMINESGGGTTGSYSTLLETLKNWLDHPDYAQSIGNKGRNYILQNPKTSSGSLSNAVHESIQKFEKVVNQ
ncbi:MAG: hypothetical protein CL421_06470 [Acidimicrobiaceae bacterium]|nr:hypothetical protein [Acidimicrobiaceae bacterium]